MKSTIIVNPPQEAIFPIALDLYLHLEAGREVDGMKVKCRNPAAPGSPVRTHDGL